MSIAGAYRLAVHGGRRVERRKRRRIAGASVRWFAGIAGWCLLLLALGWLVAAGFYGLLGHA